MNPFDSGFGPDPDAKKRMLPSVTDVVRDLAKTISADPAVLFKAARSVVAEELKKVKQGFEAAPLEVLVKRARNQLEREGSATVAASEPTPPPMPVFPARPASARGAAPGPPAPSTPARPPTSDDPFEDPTTRADLNWEKDLPIQPEDAPFRSAILPIPSRSRGPAGISAPVEPAPSAPVVPPPPAGPLRPSASGQPGAVPLEERPTESLKPLPRPAIAAGPSVPLAPPRDPDPWAEAADSPPASPRAAFERFLRSPSTPGSPAVPAVSPVSGELREPQAAVEAPDPHAAFKPRDPAVKSMSEMPPLAALIEEKPEPAVDEFHFKAAEADPPPPPRSGRRGWAVAVALVLAIGAGLAWAVREYVFRNETVKAVAPVAVRKPEPPPAAPATAATSTAQPPVAAKPKALAKSPQAPKTASASATSAASAPVQKGRAALLLTPDWAGKPAVYVIHFSSTKDRESAAKEAVKLGAGLGAPARAVEVDLGEKGVWYRVVVGEFPDVDAARAFRSDLEAKKTPGMGFVYEMRGR